LIQEIILSKNVRSIIEAVFAVVTWGGTFVATKIALQDIQPATVVFLRFAMGVAILAAGVQIRGQWQKLDKRDTLSLIGLGFLGISFHQWLQSTGMLTSAASTTAWIVTTSPVFMIILGWIILHERAGWIQIIGTLLAGMGVILVVSKGDLQISTIGRIATFGDFLILISAINWAVFSVLSRKILNRLPASLMMFYVMLFGFGFSSLVFLFQNGLQDVANLTSKGGIAVLILGVFGSGLAYIAWYDALQNLPANQAGVFLYIEPLVTMLLALIILGESVTWASLLGGAVIITGVWMVNRKAGSAL
jgi:drug/metabolite transporter (DMT)-like permease